MLGAVEDRLLAAGEDTLWISRPGKDSVDDLIEARGRPCVVGPPAGTDRLSLARELLARDWLALRTVRRYRPDVILTRSPAGVHSGRLTRTPVLYDTDDGRAVGLLYYSAGPFANLITSPTATIESYGSNHLKYRGYKELFYLHPCRFTPDPSIREELGVAGGERLFLVRLSAMTASHDFGESGLTLPQVERLLQRLGEAGTVVVSPEAEPPLDMSAIRLSTAPERFHHVLAAADLVVGDSQTVSAEAAVIGTPSLRLSSWADRLPYQLELEQRWNLTRAFEPSQADAFFGELDRMLDDLEGVKKLHRENRRRMLQWCSDPVDDLTTWTYQLAEGRFSRRRSKLRRRNRR